MSLDDDIDFSGVLNACKQQQERSLSTVSVFPWAHWAACQESESKHSGAQRIEGVVHDCQCMLNQLLHTLYQQLMQLFLKLLFISLFLPRKFFSRGNLTQVFLDLDLCGRMWTCPQFHGKTVAFTNFEVFLYMARI